MAETFNLALTAPELLLVGHALGQVDGNHKALPLLQKVRSLCTSGAPLGYRPPLIGDR